MVAGINDDVKSKDIRLMSDKGKSKTAAGMGIEFLPTAGPSFVGFVLDSPRGDQTEPAGRCSQDPPSVNSAPALQVVPWNGPHSP